MTQIRSRKRDVQLLSSLDVSIPVDKVIASLLQRSRILARILARERGTVEANWPS